MKKELKVRILIWAGMVGFLLVYLLLAWYGASQIEPKEMAGQIITLRKVTTGLSEAFLLIGFALPYLFRKSAQTLALFIIQLALFEICAFFGMIFTMISGRTEATVFSVSAAFVGMLAALVRQYLFRDKV